MKVDIKLLNEKSKIPLHGSEYAAGYDLFANCEASIVNRPLDNQVIIAPHHTEKIGTGIAVSIPNGYFGAVFARSSIATKRGLRPANCVGVIDSDYTGEIIVAIHNDTDEYMSIMNGERIAQLVIIPQINVDFNVVDELDETDRGSGGFGSTDEKYKQMTLSDYGVM